MPVRGAVVNIFADTIGYGLELNDIVSVANGLTIYFSHCDPVFYHDAIELAHKYAF